MEPFHPFRWGYLQYAEFLFLVGLSRSTQVERAWSDAGINSPEPCQRAAELGNDADSPLLLQTTTHSADSFEVSFLPALYQWKDSLGVLSLAKTPQKKEDKEPLH